MAFTPYEWPVDTEVTFYSVPWDGQYRDVVGFSGDYARDAYFASLAGSSIRITRLTYCKPYQPIDVNVPFSTLYKFNYAVVRNPQLPVPGEGDMPAFCYFVREMEFVAPNTTRVTLELDVWQTYIGKFELGRAFVERGHIMPWGLAAEYGFQVSTADVTGESLRRYANVPESLDIGDELPVYALDMVSFTPQLYPDWAASSLPDGGVNTNTWCVVITSTADLTRDPGTVSDPTLATATGYSGAGVASGAAVYAVFGQDLMDILSAGSDYPWATKAITAITMFPAAFVNWADATSVTVLGVQAYEIKHTADPVTMQPYTPGESIATRVHRSMIGNAYYSRIPKLWAFPYTVADITPFNGQQLILKPQMFYYRPDVDLYAYSMPIPPFQRISLVAARYGAGAESAYTQFPYQSADAKLDTGTISGMGLDCAVTLSDFPSLQLVNDEFTQYLAANTNVRAWSYEAAGWSQSKGMRSASVAYENQLRSMEAARTQNEIANALNTLNSVGSAIGSVASGVSSLSAGGAIGGAFNAAGSLIGAQVANAASRATLEAGQSAQSANVRANYDMANWAAQGDYENAIASINATVQDAALTQPSMSGQAGGTGFQAAFGLLGVCVRYRTMDEQHIAVVGDYLARYGWACHEYLPIVRTYRLMTKFTYWRLSDTTITCAEADEGAREALRGIFEKGVTVWTNPDDIGTADVLDNFPVPVPDYDPFGRRGIHA